jgi:Reverse transcriptase (RNA-dependent DNA polymerase).
MKLTRKNIVKCGFFPENLPTKVFTSLEISDFFESSILNYDLIANNLKSKKVENTPCLFISSHKNDLERRIIAIPHIETYIMLANEFEINISEIGDILDNNKNSYSNIIQPSSIEGYNIRSNFFKNYLDRTVFSTGYRYLLKVDLSKCYENIYTHSISWAIFGKDASKEELNKKPNLRNTAYTKADQLDKFVRSINNNETKGIPTGPISSRIVSEIILSSIDGHLREKGYHFKRYVDDYNFYFRNEVEVYEFLPHFQNILYEYKMHLNTEKTTIEKYPYQLNSDFTQVLRNHDFMKDGYLKYLEKAIELHKEGHKGALKYALKVIGKKKIPDKEKNLVFSHVINIMLTFPNLSEFIHVMLINNAFSFDSKIEQTVGDILVHCIRNKYQIETIWLLTIMGCLKMKIQTEVLCSLIDLFDPLTTILTMDYIFHYKLQRNPDIKIAIDNLKIKLKREKVYGEKWLLLYEVNRNSWIKGLKVNLNESVFLKEALISNVRFFKSPL